MNNHAAPCALHHLQPVALGDGCQVHVVSTFEDWEKLPREHIQVLEEGENG